MEQEKQRSGIRRGIAVLLTAVLLFALDQISKLFVLVYLVPLERVTVIPGLLELSYLENTGAAFGLFKNQIWLVVAVTLAAVAAITALLFRYQGHTFFTYAASALLIAGGLGNLLDRILYGFVVDFIHVLFFPYIFNFADCCVTVGACLFVIHVLVLARRESQAKKVEPPAGDDEP